MKTRFVITDVYDKKEAFNYFRRHGNTLQEAFAKANGPFPAVGDWKDGIMYLPQKEDLKAKEVLEALILQQEKNRDDDTRESGIIWHHEYQYSPEEVQRVKLYLAAVIEYVDAFGWYAQQPEEIRNKIDLITDMRMSVQA